MRKFLFNFVAATFALCSLVIIALYSGYVDSFVQVRPAEHAFITIGGKVVRQYGPGLHFKIPFLEQAEILEVLRVFETDVIVDEQLKDSTKCLVHTKIRHRIADPLRTLQWRKAQSKKLLQRQSQRVADDVVTAKVMRFEIKPFDAEPVRLFKMNLAETMGGITPAQAKNGAIEEWVDEYEQSSSNIIYDDGIQLIDMNLENISCSDNFPLPICHYEYGEKQAFENASMWKNEEHGSATMVFELDIERVILADQERLKIEGVKFGFAIADQAIFYAAVRTEKNAMMRLRPQTDLALRMSMGEIGVEGLSSYEFSSMVTDDGALNEERAASIGVKLVFIDTTNASFRIGEKHCDTDVVKSESS